MPDYKYQIKENRLKTAFINNGNIYLKPIDSLKDETSWGRLHYDVNTHGDVACIVYAAASDHLLEPDKETEGGYKRLLEQLGASRFVQQNDMMLYSLKGRYLYLAFTVTGEGEASFSNMYVDRTGDRFMETFPLVYQDHGSFFHRYLSIFSSMYDDFDKEIDELPQLLDLNNCSKELLTVYAEWLGIDIGDGFLTEEVLRELVKNAYQLNRMKGTRWCLEKITEIILGEPAVIVERNTTEDYLPREQIDSINRLYGNSLFDVTVMINNQIDETRQSQLEYILRQFLPIRCNLRIVVLNRSGTLDSYSYLDVNARVFETFDGQLDSQQSMDDVITLL